MLIKPIITLTTDFGLKDPFVGLMKGVIISINPDAEIIDLTHNIQRHNLFEAAQVISMSYRYFPPATIHIVVVDPGVGGARRPILVVTDNYYFIGPDNGIFSLIYEANKNHFLKVIHLTASHYYRKMDGYTFHGRDIFAPIAAYLSKGTESHNFGDQIEDFVRIDIPKPVITDNNVIHGEVVSIDNFGNLITNISREDISLIAPPENSECLRISFNNNEIPFVTYYAERKNEGLHAIINSFGHLELFVFSDSAAEKFNISVGHRLTVSRV